MFSIYFAYVFAWRPPEGGHPELAPSPSSNTSQVYALDNNNTDNDNKNNIDKDNDNDNNNDTNTIRMTLKGGRSELERGG